MSIKTTVIVLRVFLRMPVCPVSTELTSSQFAFHFEIRQQITTLNIRDVIVTLLYMMTQRSHAKGHLESRKKPPFAVVSAESEEE